MTSLPRIAVSACLLGEPVRYDGQEKSCAAVRDGLARFAELIPLCPEVGAGMPVPREAVDLFGDPQSPRMVGVVTGEDWTPRVQAWIDAALDRCEAAGVSGFVLKARSPSCGVGTAQLCLASGAAPVAVDGLLAAAIRRRFPGLPLVGDEDLDVGALAQQVRAAHRGAEPAPAAAPFRPRFLRPLLSLPLVLQLVGLFLPGPLLWGVGHPAYLPVPAWLVAVWPLGLLGLLWSPAGPRWGSWLVRRAEPALTGPSWIAYGLVPTLGAALAWLVRDRTHLLGDGVLLTTLLAKGQPLHGFDAFGYQFQALLTELFHARTFATAGDLAAVVSVLTGAAYFAAAAWGARRLARGQGEALLLYVLLVFAAPLQLFLGYVECYAQLTVCLLLFAVGLVRHERGETGLTVPAAWLAAALVWHATALFAVPVLAAAVAWPPPGQRPAPARRLWAAAWPLLAAVVAMVALSGLGGQDGAVFTDPVLQRHGKRLLRAWGGPRGLGDWRHWKDLINLALLTAPVALALLVAGAPWRRDAGRDRPAAVRLAVGAAWLAVPAVFLELGLGMARDWDLLAGPAVVVAVLSFAAWIDGPSRPRPVAPVVGLVALVSLGGSLPWFAVNAVTTASVRRLPAVVADLPGRPRAMALVDLGRWHREAGDLDGALEAYREAAAAGPGQPNVQLLYGQILFHRGRFEDALEPLRRAHELDPGNGLTLKMLVLDYAELARDGETLDFARKLAGRPEEDANLAGLHGVLAEGAGAHEEAIKAFERAIRLDPARRDIMVRLGSLELAVGRGPRAESVFRRILAGSPSDRDALLGLAGALLLQTRGDGHAAAPPRDPARLRELTALLDRLIAAGIEPAQLAQWRAEVTEGQDAGAQK